VQLDTGVRVQPCQLTVDPGALAIPGRSAVPPAPPSQPNPWLRCRIAGGVHWPRCRQITSMRRRFLTLP
jgi:hypothetical protein